MNTILIDATKEADYMPRTIQNQRPTGAKSLVPYKTRKGYGGPSGYHVTDLEMT